MITGAEGVGKTRFALQLTAELVPRFSDGAWLCELAGASDEESLHLLVAATLGVTAHGGATLEDAIAEFLRSRQVLLVLDNCEHLLAAVGTLAAALIQRCSDVRMLATSREGLGVSGEQGWPLPSLPVRSDGAARVVFAGRAHWV